jgi:hypothetical protein
VRLPVSPPGQADCIDLTTRAIRAIQAVGKDSSLEVWVAEIVDSYSIST